LQVGVVLIIAGTLLGAVWADKAWGRFWGWDPKEVWALVVILIYLIPLHLRLVGRVQATGLAAWSIYGFGSVIFSWYGVNFILGAGLHSYGFGTGGQTPVMTCVALQVALTTWTLFRIPRQQTEQAASLPRHDDRKMALVPSQVEQKLAECN
jgi:cytochrome c biogenesis factor